ncbi:LOW QUALITY PROTEIN: uncharacterized protein LOC129224338 [Uloborus diversus]|uniref:LOW QUALITY PROTEIN: uncharacterized protein LOC129224338 n=1 Tax=Uloborus diversus TaxID=327109 RepID=UPI00240A7DB3|nr:LOW QUALITY PROTEIN: uncharacterized protein LOC129224338 [Uloborus diversus]
MHVVGRLAWWLTWLVAIFSAVKTAMVSRLPLNFRHNHKMAFRIFYQTGNNESDLPECGPMTVCNRVDTYSTPWVERQCRCPGKKICSMSIDARDGYTVVDKSRQLKLCEPVSRLPTCRYFRDVAWTYATYPDNSTKQTMHCMCPKNGVGYIFKHEVYNTPEGPAVLYFLACSPQSQPFHCELEGELGIPCINLGPVSCRVRLDRGGYVPGESIRLSATIDNGSGVAIHRTKALLTETIQYTAKKKIVQSETRELASLQKGRIDAGTTDHWKNELLYIPPLPPTNLRGCHLIKIQYDVYFQIEPKGVDRVMSLQLPIMIATYPVRNRDGTLPRRQGTSYPPSLPVCRPWLNSAKLK